MINKILTFSLSLSILSFSYSQTQLKVATYNIQGMRPGTSPEIRIRHIIEKLKELDPDIIGLQEICEEKNTSDPQNQAVTIADALSSHFGIEYYVYQKKATDQAWWGQFKQFDAIISKYPFKAQDYITLTGGWPQKCIYGLFDTPLGEINFFSTHLSYESAWVNETEIQEILNFASTKRAITSNDNAIILGDFNTEPDRPSYLMMINAKYLDTYATINPNTNGYTAPYPNPIMRIDFIFVNEFADLVIDNSYIIMDQPISQNFYCSDHLGIMTIFSNPNYVGIEDEVTVLKSFSLSQNYPNPFNPRTTIQYEISKIGDVSINVYDILGNEVTQLVNTEQQPGTYQIDFDESNLTNGIYFYRLSQGEDSVIKKMILAK